MALTQGVKDTVDAMSDINKALLMLYAGGHDDTSKAIALGESMIKAYFRQLDPVGASNETKALAILRGTSDYWTNMFKAYKADEADVVRTGLIEEAASYMEQENPLADMPDPEPEPPPEEPPAE